MLNTQQREFVTAYLASGFNATEAAKQAKYSEKTAYSQGQRLLKHVEVRAAIDELLSEHVMARNEVLARLSDHARASLEDFMDDAGALDLDAAKKRGKLHLAKKVRRTRKTWQGITTETLEIELHDPQTALVQLGRHYRLFVDRLELDLPVALQKLLPDVIRVFGGPEQASAAFKRLIEASVSPETPETPETPEQDPPAAAPEAPAPAPPTGLDAGGAPLRVASAPASPEPAFPWQNEPWKWRDVGSKRKTRHE